MFHRVKISEAEWGVDFSYIYWEKIYQVSFPFCNSLIFGDLMSFRSIARDIRESFGSLSRQSFDVRLSGHHRGKSHYLFHDLSDQHLTIQNSCWANLPPELLFDVIRRLEERERESTWPARIHVVSCASVCRSWRSMCKEIVQNHEFCGKLTFPVSLKQPGYRDEPIQCFIKRDKSNLTFHLFLCLSPDRISSLQSF